MIRNKKVLGVLGAVAAVFITAGLLAARYEGPSKPAKPNKPDKQNSKGAPLFNEKDISTGKKISLADYKGKVVVLNFWATWCGPCVGEIPDLVKLADSYKGQLVVIGASVDDTADIAKKFVKKNKVTYPVIWASAQMQGNYGGISSIPTTFFINKNGEIADKMVGSSTLDVFKKKVKALLAETPNQPTPDNPNPPAVSGQYNFAGVDVTSGKSFKMSDYNKKIVVVNFFATWCGPCVEEIPSFVTLQNKYKDKVQFIGISIDDDAAVVKKFVKSKSVSYPVTMTKPEIESAYGSIPFIPITFIMDKKGGIIEKIEGGVSADVMEKKLKNAIK